ncbi:DUF6056 family protein [Fructilactobacillus vespulae]|uniref:DUF3329 domain-containing protein n=1 Tax=Fructilactobacillus vespulae TaxID=1249630 RepID=UPI0039B66E46
MKKNISEKFIYVVMLCVFLAMSLWSAATPIWADDFRSVLDGQPMNLRQIVSSQIWGYQHWSGRIFGEGIARILVVIPRPAFGILNGLAFLALTILMLALINPTIRRNRRALINYLFVVFALFALTPGFGQVFLWTSGSGNYLWTTTINLLFIYLLTKRGLKKTPRLVGLLMFPLAIVAGWSNETTGGGVLIFLLGYYLFNYLHTKKLTFNYRTASLIILYFVSYVMLIKAPGNQVRAMTFNNDFIHKTLSERVAVRFIQVNHFIFEYLLVILIAFLVLTVINLVWVKNNQKLEKALLWEISGLAMVYAMIFSPELNSEATRSFFAGFIFMIIGTITLLPHSFTNKRLNGLIYSLLVVMTGLTIFNVTNGVIDSSKTNEAILQRYHFIESSVNKYGENKTIAVPELSYLGKTKYSVNYGTLWELAPEHDLKKFVFPNSYYESMFGAKKIVLKK